MLLGNLVRRQKLYRVHPIWLDDMLVNKSGAMLGTESIYLVIVLANT
jgi:hypothetical protein